MNKTLIASAIAAFALSSAAFASDDGCGGCSSAAGVSASGGIFGGAASTSSAYSSVHGTGTSSSIAGGGTASAAGLSITTNAEAHDGVGTAGAVVNSYTYNGVAAYASTENHGWGATGHADANGIAGSVVGYEVKGFAAAGKGENKSIGFFKMEGHEGSFVAGGAEADHYVIHHHGFDTSGSVVAEAGTVLNAIGGIEVKNCKDVASVDGYYAEAHLAGTNIESEGHAGAIALAGTEAHGFYGGAIHNASFDFDRGHHGHPEAPKGFNNGFGNGDQDAPGNSLWHNHAENYQGGED